MRDAKVIAVNKMQCFWSFGVYCSGEKYSLGKANNQSMYTF